MSYNLLNYEGIASDTAVRNPYFRTIMNTAQPDLLVCTEIVTYAGIQGFVSNVMNDDNNNYSLGTFITGFDTNCGLVYRNDEFTFISNHPIHTDLRDINEFTIIHIASGDTLRIYAVHLKASSSASDEAQRALEVDSLRKHTNALPFNSNFIVCGDFNIYNSNESAYKKLLLDNITDDGHVNDPITLTGSFNNSSYAIYHTQSPRTRSFGGGVTGGLDDRFDMILMSNAVMQPGGITFVAGSTVAYGNDGNHYNDSINHQPNTAVSPEIADALHYASDHLPVMVTLQIENTGTGAAMENTSRVSIYPNPFNREIHFSISPAPSAEIHIQLMDVLGRIIDEQHYSAAPDITYITPALNSGIYFYRLQTQGKSMEGKLIRE